MSATDLTLAVFSTYLKYLIAIHVQLAAVLSRQTSGLLMIGQGVDRRVASKPGSLLNIFPIV